MMEVAHVSYPQATSAPVGESIASPLGAADSIATPERRRALEAMLLEFIGLLQELRKTLDQMQANHKCVSLDLLESYKEEQHNMRTERKSAQRWQAGGHWISGGLGLLCSVGAGVVAHRTGTGVAMAIDTASHVSGPAGSLGNGLGTWMGSDNSYKADEAQTGSDLAKEAMSASDGTGSKAGDESARTREDYLSQMRAAMQEITAFIKASVR